MGDPETQDELRTGRRSASGAPAGEAPEPISTEPTFGHDVHLRPEFVSAVREAIDAADADSAGELVADLHIADLADLFEVLSSEQRRTLVGLVGTRVDPRFLSELEPGAFEDVASTVPHQVMARAVAAVETDDAVHILEHLDERTQRDVLRALTREDRIAVEEGLAFPEESAGRLMQRDLIAVPEFWSVGQTIDYLRRREDEELPEDFYDLIVVDPAYRPIGTVPLSRVLRSERTTRIREVMRREPHLINVATDQEEVARQFAKYHLISAAVVSEFGRLLGVITVDDIVDVIEDEAQEDILALAGVGAGDVNIPVREVAQTRLLWLVVNLGTAILASLVIGLFDATIEQMVALAVLMPIVASMGGNAGTQTLTVAVRALATKELSAANAMRIVLKEVKVSLINGVLLALLVAVVALLWFGNPELGGVLAAAMIVNIFVAGLSGILIPMGLDRVGIDPAVASSVFVTTITDVVGFFVFLGIAGLVFF